MPGVSGGADLHRKSTLKSALLLQGVYRERVLRLLLLSTPSAGKADIRMLQPSTKAPPGQKDENITRDQARRLVGRWAERIEDLALEIYKTAHAYAVSNFEEPRLSPGHALRPLKSPSLGRSNSRCPDGEGNRHSRYEDGIWSSAPFLSACFVVADKVKGLDEENDEIVVVDELL